jgi:hypothetical protein
MERKPVARANTEPTYPPRQWRRSTWLRRALGVTALSVAMGLGACGGSGDRETDDWEDVEMAGAMPQPNFWCGDDASDGIRTFTAPGTYDGELCGTSTGWAALQIDSEGVFRLELTAGMNEASIAVIDPEGTQIAQLDDELSAVSMAMHPGRWLLAATANDPVSGGWNHFEISIESLSD